MIHLESVTPENWRTQLAVLPEQKSFVADPAGILARAFAYREQRSRAFIVYSDDTPVGMALYYDCEGLRAYDLSQLFIDARFQGRGYGAAAAELMLDEMKKDGKYKKAVLCYIEGNTAAKSLYEKLGFYETGEKDEDEIIMEKLL